MIHNEKISMDIERTMTSNPPQLVAFCQGKEKHPIKPQDIPKTQSQFYQGTGQKKNMGFLVLHGFSATPFSMHRITQALAAQGHTVLAPLLAGHGQSVQDFAQSQWQDWQCSAYEAFKQISEKCDRVSVIGLSMGGALALNLAADSNEVLNLFLLAPAVYPPWQLKYSYPLLSPLSHWGLRSIPTKGGNFADASQIDYQYPVMPLSALKALSDLMTHTQSRLSQVTTPTVLFWGEKDKVLPRTNSEHLLNQIKGKKSELILLPKSKHVLSLDYEVGQIIQRIG